MSIGSGYPYGASTSAAGCVVFLIDESRGMESRVAEGTRSRAESIATSLNALLNQLTGGPSLHLAIAGYRTDEAGQLDVGCRWAGALAGQRFVPTNQLAGAVVTVENRVRRVPDPSGYGAARQETVSFPIWYVPQLSGVAPVEIGFAFCHELLMEWAAGGAAASKPPLVIHFAGQLPGSLAAASAAIRQPSEYAATPLVFHVHLATSARLPAVLYPSTATHLAGPIRDGFEASSPLPEPLAAALRQSQVAVNPGARGFLCHAKPVDLIRFLSLVKAYRDWSPGPQSFVQGAVQGAYPTGAPVQPSMPSWPSPAVATPPWQAAQPASPVPAPAQPVMAEAAGNLPGERAALVMLLLDRSAEEPARPAPDNVWHKLQDRANELLADLARRGKGEIDVTAISYGTEAGGSPIVYSGFSASPDVAWLADNQLTAAAIRVDQKTEQVSNGIGGLLTINRNKPIFMDLAPAGAASPLAAFDAAAWVAAEWQMRHPTSRVPPIVLHFTRGLFVPADIQTAATRLNPAGATSPVLLYHSVLTERPYRSFAYPCSSAELGDSSLSVLWELTSPLLARERLAAKKPTITPHSRGMVVNGVFDVLFDSIEESW